MKVTALMEDGQRVTVPLLPSARVAELLADGRNGGKTSGAEHLLAGELHEACRPLAIEIGAELERLRAENTALWAENTVLHNEVQSLDFDLTAAREGRIGGVA